MRVRCSLREIQRELDLSKADLERELKMDSRTIDKLLADSDQDPWRLDREMLHRYVLFAHAHGFEPFRVEPHPIWTTFEGQKEVAIFRGSKRGDAPIEDRLVKYLAGLGADTHSTTEAVGVDEAMKTRNCVIIGSPKGNPASEIGLAMLWGAKPFNTAAKNRERIPINFLGMAPEHSLGPSAVLHEGPTHGIEIQPPDAGPRRFVHVDWLPPDEYWSHKGSGQDAAVLVACYRPLATQKDVTTVIIAGYTGLATLTAALEATYKKIPHVDPGERPGKPCFAVLKFRYRKRRQHGKAVDGLRIVDEGTVRWAPPWDDFFS